ncbi:Retrovirus-related Pol polyprotein from transposon TNT 1-94 [Senna tora]|uniref:Retrovirus-related Pol polyprotein from transposon TNT 1-94 n=1 Tax=Senna tora TaxID=362788 RepID=A0A834X558_9FABA|nr:Retrovirus-related Pol polyprotein from transposon TNT 1-94 [Senna tora]
MASVCVAASGKTSSKSGEEVKYALQNVPAIASKLDDHNFLAWRMQALATIKGHRLYKYLLGEKHVPLRYLSQAAVEKGEYSDEYLHWESQDQLLVSWLLNSMTDGMVNRMVGCSFSYQVWKKLEEIYASGTLARERQLKNDLRSTKKGSSSMSDFILKIKKITDALAAINSPVSAHDHIEAILDGLGEEYEGFITSFSMRKDDYSITEIEALLLAQEARLDKVKKQVENVSANLAQKSFPNGRGQQNFRGGSQGRGGNFYNNRGGGNFQNSGANFQNGANRFNRDNRSRGGARVWQNSKPQCQVCGRYGHLGVNCYNRFNQSYTEASLAQYLTQNQSSQTKINGGSSAEALIATSETVNDDAWFADSGATNHLTNDVSNLQVKQAYDGGEQVHIANGSGLDIIHIGNSELFSKSKTLKLNQILHVPDDDHRILLEGKIKKGLYLFDSLNFSHKFVHPVSVNTVSASVSSPASSSTSISSSSPNSFGIWHCRLGHPASPVVQTVLTSCNVSVPISSVPSDSVSSHSLSIPLVITPISSNSTAQNIANDVIHTDSVNVVDKSSILPTNGVNVTERQGSEESKGNSTHSTSGDSSSKSQSSSRAVTNTHSMVTRAKLVYVDDVIVTGSSTQAIQDLVKVLNSKFSLKDLGSLHYFLGIQATALVDGGLLLTQTKYVKDLLLKAEMAGSSKV